MTKTQINKLKRNIAFLNRDEVAESVKNKDYDFQVDMMYLTGIKNSDWSWSLVQELV